MRTQAAYAIVTVVVLLAVTFWLATARKRQAEKLRRRGIKNYNRSR